MQAAEPPAGHASARKLSLLAMNEEPAEMLAERVRATRKTLGLSLTDLAAQPGLSRSYISRIELGHRQPSMKVLRALAATLGVSVHWLETGREDPAIELAREVLKPGREATPKMRRLAQQILGVRTRG